MSEKRTTHSRPIQSCVQCRRRKIKCSREVPCAQCIIRKEADTCCEVTIDKLSTGKSDTLDDVLRRVTALEYTVTRLSHLVPPDERPPSRATDEESSIGPTIRASFGRTSADEDVAMMLEDFAMGRKVNRSRAAEDLDDDSEIYGPSSSASWGSIDSHSLTLVSERSGDVVTRLLALLPDDVHCNVLTQFYFERLSWHTKVLHSTTFLNESTLLLIQRATNDFSTVRLSFLGVYLMTLCLALHLIEPNICLQLGIDVQFASQLSKRMYSGSQACLHYDDFLGSHSLEHLQCIVLMGLYQQNLDAADTHWALLGSAIKIAQNLGMSRLGSEMDGKTYSACWKSVVSREIGRRVWWNLIFDDWSNAAAHNGTYSVHPSQNHTALPANINDADLIEGRSFQEKPATEYTEMTFFLCRLRFVALYRQIVDKMQTPAPYDFIVEMDSRLVKHLSQLPSSFQMTSPAGRTVKDLEMTLCLMMGHTRLLRLHRPFLFSGYKDKRFVKSKEQCVSSARAILNLLQSDVERSSILLKTWIVLFYGFAAAIVLFIDLCHHCVDKTENLDSKRDELKNALGLFKAAENISIVSRNAINLLESLMDSEKELTSNTQQKRGAPDEDPFERIVKRILTDAPASSAIGRLGQPSHDHDVSSILPPLNDWSHYGHDTFGMVNMFKDDGVLDDAALSQLAQLLDYPTTEIAFS